MTEHLDRLGLSLDRIRTNNINKKNLSYWRFIKLFHEFFPKSFFKKVKMDILKMSKIEKLKKLYAKNS